MLTLDEMTEDELQAAHDQRERRRAFWAAIAPASFAFALFVGHILSYDSATPAAPRDYVSELRSSFVSIDTGTSPSGEPYVLDAALAEDGTVCEQYEQGLTRGGSCGRGDVGYSTDALVAHGVVSDRVATVQVGGGERLQVVDTRAMPPQFGKRRYFLLFLNGTDGNVVMKDAAGRVLNDR